MRVILYMAQTLNGFIARENDEAPWSDTVFQAYYALIREQGNIIIGRKTYDVMMEAGDFAHLNTPKTIVLSQSINSAPDASVAATAQAALDLLQDFETVIVAGGAKCNTAFFQAGLIDELIIDVEPQIFGRGISFFTPFDGEAQLKLLGIEELGEAAVRLRYSTR